MGTVSVILNTFNEEKNIERCLNSVTWADEIVVIDSFSTDRTRELAKRFTDKIFTYEYPGNSRQSARGIAHASGEWIFIIDADEVVTEELARSIKTVAANPSVPDGFRVNRKVFIFGAWVTHGGWFPDWQFRFFRKGKEIPIWAEVHGGFTTKEPHGRLDGLLLHYTYETIGQYLEKLNDYTSLQVSNKLKDEPDFRIPWHKILLSPPVDFLRTFFGLRGYKDGMHGLLLSVLSAMYTFAYYAKAWEYRHRRAHGGILPPITNAEIRLAKLGQRYMTLL